MKFKVTVVKDGKDKVFPRVGGLILGEASNDAETQLTMVLATGVPVHYTQFDRLVIEPARNKG